MTRPPASPLDARLRRVALRLVLRRLAVTMPLFAAAVLAAFGAAVLIEYHLVPGTVPWSPLAQLGVVAVLPFATAAVVGRRSWPSRVDAALALDGRFRLKERVTTAVSLRPEETATPAGAAVLADAARHVAGLRLADGFPIRFRRSALALPAAALLCAAVLVFDEPSKVPSTAAPVEATTPTTAADDAVAERLRQFKKDPAKPPAPETRSRALKDLEDELDRIASKPAGSDDDLRDRAKELADTEAEAKQFQERLTKKEQRREEALAELAKKSDRKDGPASGLRDSLADGDLDAARKEADRLRKKLRDRHDGGNDADTKDGETPADRLAKKDRTRLAEQMRELAEDMHRLSRQEDKVEELKRLQREGAIDRETLDRELENLAKENEQLKDVDELARDLDQAAKRLDKGDDAAAAKALEQARDKMSDMAQDKKDGATARRQADQIKDVRKQIYQRLNARAGTKPGGDEKQSREAGKTGKAGQGKQTAQGKTGEGQSAQGQKQPGKGAQAQGQPGQGDDGTQGEQAGQASAGSRAAQAGRGQRADQNQQSGRAGTAGQGAGRRPDGDPIEAKGTDQRQTGRLDTKGQIRTSGYRPGKNYVRKSSAEVDAEIKQAAQEAPEAIERQNIPREARDMTRGYFKNLAGKPER